MAQIYVYIDDLVQDRSNSTANALELLQSFTKPSIYYSNLLIIIPTGGRLNKKDGLTRYGNSHVKDKTS